MKDIRKNNDNLLDKAPMDTGYSVPKGYFETVEDVFSMKLQEGSLPKGNPFETPKGYFENLEDRILSKVELPKKGKVISLRKRLIQWIPASAAACILLFIGINYYTGGVVEPTFTNDEFTVWFDNNVTSITNDDISIALEDSDFEDASFLDGVIEDTEITDFLDEDETYKLIEDSDIFINEIN